MFAQFDHHQPRFSNEMRPIVTNTTVDSYDVEVFYDGGCPLCVREIGMLRRWDRRQKIRFTDIDAMDFQAADYGKSYEELMAQMHGRLPDGTWIRGVEVFRRLYTTVGFGPLVFLSRLPVISQTLDLGYVLFAKNRLRLTGRCTTDSCQAKPAPESRTH
jgi:predicted DCC family thiol-disulfide oxidoreductase YuxK